jgi:hypothetical protein
MGLSQFAVLILISPRHICFVKVHHHVQYSISFSSNSRLRRAGCITQHQGNIQIREPLATSILMKVVSSTVAPFSPPLKMEERKRSATQSVDDLAPPTKRQAVNGASKTSADSDMPWKDDLEVSVTRPPHSLLIFSLCNHCKWS